MRLHLCSLVQLSGCCACSSTPAHGGQPLEECQGTYWRSWIILGVLSSDSAFSRLLGCWLLACVAVDLLLSWTCSQHVGWVDALQNRQQLPSGPLRQDAQHSGAHSNNTMQAQVAPVRWHSSTSHVYAGSPQLVALQQPQQHQRCVSVSGGCHPRSPQRVQAHLAPSSTRLMLRSCAGVNQSDQSGLAAAEEVHSTHPRPRTDGKHNCNANRWGGPRGQCWIS